MAVTTAQSALRVRESTSNIPAARRVRDVSKTIHYLDPSEAPFTLLAKEANSRSVFNTKYEWIEKDLPTKSSLATDTSVTTAVPVTAGTGIRFHPNDLVLNTTSGEIMLVESVSTDTLTVVRTVGTVATTANVVGDTLLVIGTAYPEGAALGTPRSVTEGYLYNYTQIFRQPFGTTGTESVSENYTGRDRTQLRKDHGIYHAIDIERAFLFGNAILDTTTVPSVGASTATPFRTTGGFMEFVTTNLQAAGGVLTEPELETFCQTVFTSTGSGMSRTLFCAPLVISVVDQLAAGRLQMVPSNKTFGIAVNQWLTSHGTLNLVKHRLLGVTPYTGYALAVDTGKIAYAKLRERDTKLREDVGTPGDDGWTDEYLTECGFELHNQTAHGILTGVTA
jgi:hypothetical protein